MTAGVKEQPGAPCWAQCRQSLNETGSPVTSHRNPTKPVGAIVMTGGVVVVTIDIPLALVFVLECG